MEFLSEYGLFLAKSVTVVIAIVFILGAIFAQAAKNKQGGLLHGHIEVQKINERFKAFEHQLKHAVLPEHLFKQEEAAEKKQEKALKKQQKNQQGHTPSLFVINFEGDVKASEVEKLRHEISAILTIATPQDEVVINIESPGGMVHTYGLAASQLQRIRSAGIPLTVCVDKVAASGGYLMACVANRILAAPFALVGSIGVLAQIPNFNRALKKLDVDYEVMTAGEYKAPVTLFGEISEKGRKKLQEELEDTHVLFKEFIMQHRSQVAIEKVATGEVWYGQRALDKQLVDEIITSDDYLMQHRKDKDIYEVTFIEKKSLQEKLGQAFQQGVSSGLEALLKRNQEVSIGKDIT